MNIKNAVVVGLAFFQRAFARHVYGKEVESRARRYLRALKEPPISLRFKIALVNLRMESDLLDEDAALLPVPLELQLKVIDLADTEQIARQLCEQMLNEPPMAKLFRAVLESAKNEGTSHLRIDFSGEETPLQVWFEHGGIWKESITGPASLKPPLMGFAVRASHADYRKLRMLTSKPLPESASFRWESKNQLFIDLAVEGS